MKYFGKDCPKGMVQVEFVGTHSEKYSEYGWKPSEHAFIEIYIDGERYRLEIGDFNDGSGKRGIHINGPLHVCAEKIALNAVNIYPSKPEPA